MEEWKEYKFTDLCDLIGGGTPKTSESSYWDGDIPWLSVKDFGNEDKYVYATEKSITQEGLNNSSTKLLYKDDIIISARGTIGAMAMIKTPMAFNQSCFGIRGNFLVDKHYLYYLTKTKIKELQKNSHGSVFETITRETFAKIDCCIPSVEEQKQIASILSSLDDKIENNRRINDNLEQQAQALFKSWFVDFEPFRDGEFVESELGMIPKGWKVGCLEELCSFISRGLTPKYDNSTNEFILGQTCVRNNIVSLNNARKHLPKIKNEKWVKQWDVLINSTGIGSLGRVGVVYFDMNNVAIDSHITVVRAKSPLFHHYIGRNLLGRQLEIENMAVGSTGQTELPRDRVKAMTILVPADSTLNKFNAIIEPMALSMYRNLEENKRLAELRDTLLPKLMSGELKVGDKV